MQNHSTQNPKTIGLKHTIPLKSQDFEIHQAKTQDLINSKNNIRVLYMDDDLSLHYLARFILERSNCVVDIASNGLMGLEMYETGVYDVVAVDQDMPELSGLEVINLITNAHAHPPVIMVTTVGDEEMAVAAMRSGVSDYIVKDAGGRFLQLLPKVILQVVQQHRMKQDWSETQLELALEKERGRLLTDFISKASHEFRTPLTIISTVASLIEKVGEDSRTQKWIGRIQDQCKNIDHLLANMLVLTELDQGITPKKPVDLETFFRSLAQRWSLLCEESEIDFQYTSEKKLPLIMAASEELARAFEEILQNAIQYSSEGMKIKLDVATDQNNNLIIIQIIDEGIGIPDIHIPHLFDTFYRVDQAHSTRGFGLGLPIAQKIINLHRGTCELSSQEGAGTSVTIQLPMY